MSAAHDDAHAFDGEPARTLPADEPRTPGWLPALGVALFLGAGVYFMATSEGFSAPAPPAVGKEAAPSKPVALKAAVAKPAVAKAAAPPSPLSSAEVQVMAQTMERSPEKVKELQKRIEELRKKREAQGGQPAAPGVPAAPVAPTGGK